jgi:hypothetical protein
MEQAYTIPLFLKSHINVYDGWMAVWISSQDSPVFFTVERLNVKN